MARTASGAVLQLKMTLKGFRPPIWRRVLVPASFDLAKLHRVIQCAFGWEDCHLHVFTIGGRAYGPQGAESREGWLGERTSLAGFRFKAEAKFSYLYDLGDAWTHGITVEEIQFPETPLAVPLCLGGRRVSPPEASGGPVVFQEMLEAALDPGHPRCEEVREFLAVDWDPNAFHRAMANRALQEAFGTEPTPGRR